MITEEKETKQKEYFCTVCTSFPYSYFAIKPKCYYCVVGEEVFQKMKKDFEKNPME